VCRLSLDRCPQGLRRGAGPLRHPVCGDLGRLRVLPWSRRATPAVGSRRRKRRGPRAGRGVPRTPRRDLAHRSRHRQRASQRAAGGRPA
jgi:hypothetical protein